MSDRLFAKAAELDAADPLAGNRDLFVIPDPDLIYMDGNSLGRLPRRAQEMLDVAITKEWGDRLIRSWNEGWWEAQLRIGDLLAPLVGAGPGEVMISDSTSGNIFKLASAALDARPDRTKIVTDDLNFPTDVHVISGLANSRGIRVEVVPSDGVHGPVDGLASAIDDTTALVALSHTCFKSGYTYDLKEVTSIAHEAGAMVLWDCSHSVGAMPIDLGAADVDLAIGCTYKHLNGGPGSPAFLYVREDLQADLANPMTGWWGHADPFSFDLEFRPVEGIRRFHTGTMPMLSLIGAEAGIAETAAAGIDAIRAKSEVMTEFFINAVDTELASEGFTVASPRDVSRRGSHVSIRHEYAWPITRALVEEQQVIPDFRTPDNIRFGFSPQYTTFTEVAEAITRTKAVMATQSYLPFVNVTAIVT